MECLIDTYFEPLAHSDEQDVVALVTEITNLQVHERELLEANCIEVRMPVSMRTDLADDLASLTHIQIF